MTKSDEAEKRKCQSTLDRDRTKEKNEGKTALPEAPGTIPGTTATTGLSPAELVGLVEAMSPEDRAALLKALRD